MKSYIQPQNRIIDLYEEGDILALSDSESSAYDVVDDYADEEALTNKKNMWNREGIWSDCK